VQRKVRELRTGFFYDSQNGWAVAPRTVPPQAFDMFVELTWN
jgi:hypothetical protein